MIVLGTLPLHTSDPARKVPPAMKSRIVRLLLLVPLALAGVLRVTAPAAADPGPVTAQDMQAADGCYTWGRTLSQGASGDDVRQLPIRVAGYPGCGGALVV